MSTFTKSMVTAALVAVTMVASVASAEVNSHSDTVQSERTRVWTMSFNALEPVHIVLRGDGDTGLDLKVEDNNGYEIASSLGGSDRKTVRFTPARNGSFKVRVINRGTVYNEYQLTVRTASDASPNVARTPNVIQAPNVLRTGSR